MGPTELTSLSISELSGLISHKRVSPPEVCDAYLRRIKSIDGTLGCYVTLLEQETVQAATVAEREIAAGGYRGPLHGIPVGIKDNLNTKGVRTAAGSKILDQFIPVEDAAVVERLKAAGAIIIGKLNMHELAMGGTTINPYFGTTRNPWNLDYTPAGSSGGSGAAVAAGLCAAALGTDAAGSIRYPAAACGIVGLKPTYGRVSRYGQLVAGGSQDHVGPMTRTVRDAALLLQVLAGHDARDPTSARTPVPDFTAMLETNVRGLRLGIPKEPFTRVSREVDETVQKAVAVLEGLGMTIEEVALPHARVEYASAMKWPIAWAENHGSHLRELLRRYHGELKDLAPDIAMSYVLARLLPASFYIDAQKARRILIREFDEALTKVDVIVTPVKPVPGQTIAEGRAGLINMDGRSIKGFPMLGAFGIVYNLTGLPALTVPCGFSQAGVPIGLQIAGRPFEEGLILRVANAFEQATPWHRMRPPI